MELSVRDWMIIVGGLLIVVVLLDGYRRVRSDRRERLRMSIKREGVAERYGDDYNPELPNGGARLVGDELGRQEPSFGDDADPLFSEYREPEYLDDSVEPTAVEGAALGDIELEPESAGADEQTPQVVEAEAASDPVEPQQEVDSVADESSVYEPESDRFEGETDVAVVTEPEQESEEPVPTPPRSGYIDMQQSELLPEDEFEPEPPQPVAEVEEVIIINVMSRSAGGFAGAELTKLLLACDVRFGSMNIFHRHEDANGRGAIQFSVANSVEPGTFNLDDIEDFSTPGVTMFLQLPGPKNSAQAFNCMVETAQCLANNLNGEMRDEGHSVITSQTLQHSRQRIQDFERRKLTQTA